MALTRSFKDTVKERAARDDPEFPKGSVECMLADDIETGKSILKDYINATVGMGVCGPFGNTATGRFSGSCGVE